ncbi:MAG: hypothetical protein RQ826_13635 [Xanthomonadales bacterium]|nr:hypothetical protein [Xanthomonadales bacterium]
MNHLEGIISEWLENTGYIVARNHKVGRRVKGGWGGELDIIAYNPETNHLVHYEPSVDANSWARREERFKKKFAMGRQHVRDIPQLSFLTQEQVDSMEQIAVFPQVSAAYRDYLGGKAIGMDELMGTINQFVRKRGPMAYNAFPEQYPMLRTLQFALCGYYKVVSP